MFSEFWNALAGEFDVRSFDPAIPEFAIPPDPADLVACIDVLEHVEPNFLENVLVDLARVTFKVAFCTIATRPAGKQLADGTNCHRIIEVASSWTESLERHFRIVRADAIQGDNGLHAVVVPK